MLSVIGDLLPISVAIASNPVVIIVMVLLLLSPRGPGAGAAYLAGWVAGILAAMGVIVLLASFIGDDGLPTFAVVEILLGAGLVFLGWKQWKGRSVDGEPATLPSWMAAVDAMAPARAFGLGLMLAAANPKNIVLVAAAAVIVAAADLQTGAAVTVIVVFTVVSTISIGGPFIAYLIAPGRMALPLRNAREWLIQNNSVIMAVLLGVMGVVVIGNGLSYL